MEDKLQKLQSDVEKEVADATTAEALEQIRIKYLGRKGLLRGVMADISKVPAEQRREVGQAANRLKDLVSRLLDEAKGNLTPKAKVRVADEEAFDISMPGTPPKVGHTHPLVQTIEDLKDIFGRLGFGVAEGPEVEFDYYIFEALTIPADHPSRDDFDTFYVTDKVLLRSQTSTVQIRVMEKQKPPIRMIAPGKVYRPDTVDASHSFMFHQVEGLMVDESVTFGDLKGVLTLFVKAYFGGKCRMRFRPSFFPFTEPSAEVDISCVMCEGNGCSVCSHTGWLEILGCGMVDPNVFEAVGYDAEKYTGFAFGMGVERITMLKHRINDIRLFFDSDVRFLRQF